MKALHVAFSGIRQVDDPGFVARVDGDENAVTYVLLYSRDRFLIHCPRAPAIKSAKGKNHEQPKENEPRREFCGARQGQSKRHWLAGAYPAMVIALAASIAERIQTAFADEIPVPVLTIEPTGTNQFLISITNGVSLRRHRPGADGGRR